MAEMERQFEDKLRDAALDNAEATLVGEEGNLIFEFVELVHERLRSYGRRHGYDVEPTIDSFGTPEVQRSRGRLTITVGWESDQMARWEFGTSDHTINGDPVLSFVWADTNTPADDPPDWVKEEFDQARDASGQFRSGWRVFLPDVNVKGIPESRAIRDAIRGLNRVLES